MANNKTYLEKLSEQNFSINSRVIFSKRSNPRRQSEICSLTDISYLTVPDVSLPSLVKQIHDPLIRTL